MVGGDTGDGIHVIFVGTDHLAAFMNSFPLKINQRRFGDFSYKKSNSNHFHTATILYFQYYLSVVKCSIFTISILFLNQNCYLSVMIVNNDL